MESPDSQGELDPAQEKLVSDSNSSGSKIEIKFVTDPKNGDTKVDISAVKDVFVGMGKEELMRFANDPFWVRVRLILFILFWGVWFAMLAGAVAIILLAPKCPSQSTSAWYRQSPIYEVNVKNFKDNSGDGVGDLAGLESKLDYLKEDLGVETILLDPVFKTAEGTDDVVDFKSVHPDYGTLQDLKKLISSVKDKGLHILMKIVPNYSSDKHEWFVKSVAKEEPFNDYYVWTDPLFDGDTHKPKNNWLSVYDDSAWTYNPERKQYYLHQFNKTQPDLNFRNEGVIKYFEEVFKFWLDLGFDGLYLEEIEYLVEDSKMQDESFGGEVGKTHDQYESQTHSKTSHLQESYDILKRWSNIFKSKSAVLIVSDLTEVDYADVIIRPFKINAVGEKQKSIEPNELKDLLEKRLNKKSQGWEFSCQSCDGNLQAALQAILLLLPGSTIFKSGVELGLPPSSVIPWDAHQGIRQTTPEGDSDRSKENVATELSNSSSYLLNFKKIILERHDSSILSGSTDLRLLNSSVLAFTRSKLGSPHYLTVFNSKASNQTVNLQPLLKGIDVKLTLISGFNNGGIKTHSSSPLIEVPGSAFLLYRYIPDSE